MAQVSVDSEEQRRRAQQEAEDRRQRQQAPDVLLQPAVSAVEVEVPDLPDESPCFLIDRLSLDGQRAEAFSWLETSLAGYVGRCIGQQGINRIVRRVSALILAKGYITTRVGVPEQDLAKGSLRLTLVPGIIRAIRIEGGAPERSWRSAFPARPGDLLNLRDIEQGLEQMKRVPSLDVDISIAPGDSPGESDIVLTVKHTRPWRASFSVDDSGAKATGKLQGSLTFAVDNPLGVNDLLSASVNNNLDHHGDPLGSRGHSVQYSVPWGNWTATLSDASYNFHQTVQGINQRFVSSGKNGTQVLRLQRLIHRDQTSKTSLQFRTQRREQHSYLDDVEIAVQSRVNAAAELALIHRQNLGEAQLDINLAQRRGVRWFGSVQDAPGRSSDSPTYAYTLNTLDLSLSAPFKVADVPLHWNATFHGQTSHDVLYTTEQMAIGGRNTVRGFSGETTLSAERGWFLRNEIGIPITQTGQTVFAGIDHGEVSGPSAGRLSGRRLTGAVVGLRGSVSGVSYEIFTGWGLNQPDGFSRRPAIGFQLFYQY